MFRKIVAVSVLLVSLGVIGVCAASFGLHGAATAAIENSTAPESAEIVAATNGFSVEVLIYGSPASEYAARGNRYIEALENAEYELRVHNPGSSRVAVALELSRT